MEPQTVTRQSEEIEYKGESRPYKYMKTASMK